MSLFVKLCGLRSEQDVVAAIDAGADAVGFVMTDSPRQVSIATASRLIRMLPDEVLGVAVFHKPGRRLLFETMDTVVPDLLQAELSYLEGVPVASRLPVAVAGPGLADEFGASLAGSGRHLALVDRAARGGTGERSDWGQLATLPGRDRMIVAGGLDSGNVAQAVRLIGPYGVDVSSGIERAPGEKDPALMRTFVDAARSVGHLAGERGPAGEASSLLERNPR